MSSPGKGVLALARLTSLPRFQPALEVVRIDVAVPDLPADLDGFRIAQVSDLHVGPGAWGPMRVDEAAALIADERPDVVVNSGDYLLGSPTVSAVAAVAARFLREQHSVDGHPLHLATLGNHDYYAGPEPVVQLKAALEGIGVQVLVNEAICVRKGSAGVSFVGLNQREPGYAEEVARLDSYQRPLVLLVHEADVVERLPAGSVDLALAGHTHGGQVAIPPLTPLIVRHFCGSRYIEGRYRINGNPTYINRGLGCTGLPLRYRAAPEVTFLRLIR